MRYTCIRDCSFLTDRGAILDTGVIPPMTSLRLKHLLRTADWTIDAKHGPAAFVNSPVFDARTGFGGMWIHHADKFRTLKLIMALDKEMGPS